ncbi:MAG: hypothetical protein AAFQ83_17490 [Bacteroidota bacterium]
MTHLAREEALHLLGCKGGDSPEIISQKYQQLKAALLVERPTRFNQAGEELRKLEEAYRILTDIQEEHVPTAAPYHPFQAESMGEVTRRQAQSPIRRLMADTNVRAGILTGILILAILMSLQLCNPIQEPCVLEVTGYTSDAMCKEGAFSLTVAFRYQNIPSGRPILVFVGDDQVGGVPAHSKGGIDSIKIGNVSCDREKRSSISIKVAESNCEVFELIPEAIYPPILRESKKDTSISDDPPPKPDTLLCDNFKNGGLEIWLINQIRGLETNLNDIVDQNLPREDRLSIIDATLDYFVSEKSIIETVSSIESGGAESVFVEDYLNDLLKRSNKLDQRIEIEFQEIIIGELRVDSLGQKYAEVEIYQRYKRDDRVPIDAIEARFQPAYRDITKKILRILIDEVPCDKLGKAQCCTTLFSRICAPSIAQDAPIPQFRSVKSICNP